MPQQNNPEEQREMEELRRRQINQRPGIGSGWRSWWIVPVVIFFIGLLWFAGWGWGSYGGWWWGNRSEGVPSVTQRNYENQGNAANNQGGIPATNANPNNAENSSNNTVGPAILSAANKRQYVGQPFEISSTPVLKKINDRVFWVGTDAATALLVVGANNANVAANIKDGEQVNVVGTVDQAPGAQDAARNWHLGPAAAQRLEKEGAYVNATQVTPIQR